MRRLSWDRNGTSIFAERAQKNLDFIALRAAEGDDVHPVTQAVLALLGIVVFPWETSAFDIVKRRKLPMLYATGWPKWEMAGSRRVNELGELIKLLRNAVSHGNIEFNSDSRVLDEVIISFKNIPVSGTEADWVGTVRADQLIKFCRLFTSEILAQVR
jgi:hypothetical protein